MSVAATGAVWAASLSALGFAASAAVQHRASARLPAGLKSPVLVLAAMTRNRDWCLAMALSAVALWLHAVALHGAPVALVQPIMMAGVVLAVPARALIGLRRPSAREVAAVAVTAGGLALFMASVDPSAGEPTGRHWQRAAVVVAVLVIAAGCSRLSRPTTAHGVQLAVLAGVFFGITAVTLKAVATTWSQGGVAAVATDWATWSWLAAGFLGVATNQRAYRLAALSTTLPVINLVNVVVAIGLGYLLFAEAPAHRVAALAGQAAGLALAAAGMVATARLLAGPVGPEIRPLPQLAAPASRRPPA